MKSITFINKSKLPIIIEAWQTHTYGLSELEEVVVKSGEQTTIKSEDGEWRLQTSLQPKLAEEWQKSKYIYGHIIGIIYDKPTKEENTSLVMYENDFKLKYDNETRVATFSQKSTLKKFKKLN
jgi:hypothetical protein